MNNKKFIFVTGGVVSSLGKGIASASIGFLLKSRGFKVNILKLDPYINVDPGTMSPFQHGEVFVTDDGGETDLDLGHYERFLHQPLAKMNNTTAGKIYETVIAKERRGDYLGNTVQVIPHITDQITEHILRSAKDYDILLTEIGGTVGDIEGLPFLEAIRQIRLEYGSKNVLFVHLTLVPYIEAAEELKTKPTQHSVQKLREIGIQPDVLICRSNLTLPKDIRKKISLFTNVDMNAVISSKDVGTIYEIPLVYKEQGLDSLILELLRLEAESADTSKWEEMVEKLYNPSKEVEIAVCGKYNEVKDAYKSILESFIHAGYINDCKVNIKWIDTDSYESEKKLKKEIKTADAVLVPGGFGQRGIEGKISAVMYARKYNIPFFGICLGMQCAVIEFARNVLKWNGANSEEFDSETEYPVISLMANQNNIINMGGTMRLGEYSCRLKEGSKALDIYKDEMIYERHRHRYEFNNAFRDDFSEHGMVLCGESPDLGLIEMIELEEHPWFIGVQFHPELKSRPLEPHPLFVSFVKAALKQRENRLIDEEEKEKE